MEEHVTLFQRERQVKGLTKIFLLTALCSLFMSIQMFDNYTSHSSYCENKNVTFTCFSKNVFVWACVRVCTPLQNATPRPAFISVYLYLNLQLLRMYLDLRV